MIITPPYNHTTCYLWTYSAPCSSVSIVNFEQINAGWEAKLCTTLLKILLNWFLCKPIDVVKVYTTNAMFPLLWIAFDSVPEKPLLMERLFRSGQAWSGFCFHFQRSITYINWFWHQGVNFEVKEIIQNYLLLERNGTGLVTFKNGALQLLPDTIITSNVM